MAPTSFPDEGGVHVDRLFRFSPDIAVQLKLVDRPQNPADGNRFNLKTLGTSKRNQFVSAPPDFHDWSNAKLPWTCWLPGSISAALVK